MSTELACPKCKQIDMVQKLSSVIGSGTSIGSFTGSAMGVGTTIRGGNPVVVGGVQNMAGSSSTETSLFLAPPKKPSVPDRSLLLVVAIIITGISFIISLCGLLFIINYIAYGNITPSSIITILLMSSVGVLPLLLGIGLIALCIYLDNKSKKEVHEQIPIWERAMQKWNSLYYCARDDIVFIPNTNEIYSIAEYYQKLFQ